MKYTPHLIKLSMETLMKQVKLKADSNADPICGVFADGETTGGLIVNICQEIGPLMGCEKFGWLSCSSILAPVLSLR